MLNKTLLLVLLSVPILLISQENEKIKKLPFCGFSMKDTIKMKQQCGRQLDFLQIQSNDTIVDIGAQSGSYEGMLSAIGQFENVTFMLVDIDTNCLNSDKVHNMITHYESVKGKKFTHNFWIINNTQDSLWLPKGTFKKVWILNTLHEISDKEKMIRNICNVLASGGELIITELMPTAKHPNHGGCKKPLLTKNEIEKICSQNGFVFKEEIINPVAVKKMPNPMYMFRYLKS